MSRPLRIEYPGAWYHVMNRASRGEEDFSSAADYKTILVEENDYLLGSGIDSLYSPQSIGSRNRRKNRSLSLEQSSRLFDGGGPVVQAVQGFTVGNAGRNLRPEANALPVIR